MVLPLAAIMLLGRGAHSRDPGAASPEPATEQAAARNPDFAKAFANALPYADEAKRQGLAVDDAEVGRRLATYRKLYPGNEVDAEKVAAILLAEAYLQLQDGKSGSREPEARFESLKKESFPDEGEFARARQSLQTHARLEREETRAEGRKLSNLDNLRKRMSRPPPTGTWPIGELQIPGDPRACLAWIDSECYVTVEEFNAAAGQFEFPRDLPLDSARIGVVSRYALAKQASDAAGDTPVKGGADGPDLDPEQLLMRFKAAREASRWRKSALEYGLPVMDEGVLRDTYRTYYPRYFRAREDVTLELIGSTDSAYIDSLHGILARWRDAAARKADSLPAEAEPALPWSAHMEPDLPPELVAPTDTFRVGDFTAPIRTPYGFFLVKLSKLVPVREVDFEDALAMLTFLATRDNFLATDSLSEVRARQYYDRHPQEFVLPDTLELRAWLAPAPSVRQAKTGKPSMAPPDTLLYRSLRMNSLDLPDPVRRDLQAASRKDPRKAFFGPFGGMYGRWHFHVKRIGRAEGRIPYGIARRAIRERMSTLPVPARDTLTSEAAKDQVMLNLALARSHRNDRRQALREQAAREFEERVRSGAIDSTRFPEGEGGSEGMQLARNRVEEEILEKSLQRDRDFLGRIRIEMRLLN